MIRVFRRPCLLAWFGLLAFFGARAAGPIVTDDATHSIANARDARYCEIIPVVRDGFRLIATVYNTLGLNDCPAEIWNAITEADMRRHFGAVTVLLNGPRHFLMDTISGDGATAAGKTIEAGGLAMAERASLDLGIFDLPRTAYRERKVDRETRYLFKAGGPVFALDAPDGSRYVMQAYAQIVDKELTYAALPTLGARLKLPSGWHYSMLMISEDLILGSRGQATIVQDELQNTYQKVD
ncbi:hypothetical protein [Microvirga massiliensis]|uniref:hypothetical protein n=1 Tax=Microvirga massiliensis TaxID=1033741 RepID=UPI00069BA0FC|nr:hypothetical protein [Microvirga massiliensis]